MPKPISTRALALFYLYKELGLDALDLYDDPVEGEMLDFFSIIAENDRLFLKHLSLMSSQIFESYLERIR